MIPTFLLLVIVTILVPAQINASPCLLTPDPGYCRAYFPRYFFNTTSGSCELFIWGGCQGTVPFETLKQCQSAQCAIKKTNITSKRKSSRCQQIPSSGPCRAFIPRYFYDQTTKLCEQFIWGGCRGMVPFQTFNQCQRTCVDRNYDDDADDDKDVDTCITAPDRGPCTQYIQKYFFNHETNRCEQFIWGGCAGNVPFHTHQQCQAARCDSQKLVYTQEPDAEPSDTP